MQEMAFVFNPQTEPHLCYVIPVVKFAPTMKQGLFAIKTVSNLTV